MRHEPIKPGPIAPRHWIPLYLAMLVERGEGPSACAGAYTTQAKVDAMRKQSGYFHSAVCIILRERRRARLAGQVVPPAAPSVAATQSQTVSAADFCQFAGNSHAKEVVMHADVSTLLLLCKQIAAQVGIEDAEGLPIIDWFNRQRRVQLEREILAIGDSDPNLAEYLQRQFEALRGKTGADSIVQPPED